MASSNYATTQDLANVAHRVDALEAALVKSGAILPSDLENFLLQARAKITSAPVSDAGPARVPKREHVEDDDDDIVSDTEGAALTLEHLAFGRSRVDGSHSLPVLSGRKPSSVSKPVPGQGYHLASTGTMAGEGGSHPHLGSPQDAKLPRTMEERQARLVALSEALAPMDVFEMCCKRTDIVLSAVTRALPSRERGELLVNAFLVRVDWLHRGELTRRRN